jgi:hypothetical protein
MTSEPTELEILFRNGPKRIVITLENYLPAFLADTGIKVDSQHHHEITRQCFDTIGYGYKGFDLFQSHLKLLPNFSNLLDHDNYFDHIDNLFINNLNSKGIAVKEATFRYGVGIYLVCHENGLFIGNDTPYILETIKGSTCLLYNSAYPNYYSTV